MVPTVSFTPRPLYFPRNLPLYALDSRLDGPQSRSERYGVEKNLAPGENRIPVVAILSELFPFSVMASCLTDNFRIKLINYAKLVNVIELPETPIV
jgi:hypothetical protein